MLRNMNRDEEPDILNLSRQGLVRVRVRVQG